VELFYSSFSPNKAQNEFIYASAEELKTKIPRQQHHVRQ